MNDGKKPKSLATREAILQATSQVILDRGVEKLTLDAVAHQAGVSKGGLLYHFPNKESLVTGLINQLRDEFETKLQEEYDQDDTPGTPGQWVRAYVRATLRFNKQLLAIITNLSNAAATTNPELFEIAREQEKLWQQKVQESGIDPVRATIIQLAIDGLWFSESLGLPSPDESMRTQVVERLLAMTKESP